MVRQRFRVLFRRWFFTLARVFGPILLFELFELVRQYFRYAPLSMSDLLMAAFWTFLLTAVLCWLWAVGEGLRYWLRRLRGFSRHRKQYSGSYWKPEAARVNKV
jgi:hypothetical protein